MGSLPQQIAGFQHKTSPNNKAQVSFQAQALPSHPIKGKIDHEKVFTTTGICTVGKLTIGTEPVRGG
jgi:hypothetical protein